MDSLYEFLLNSIGKDIPFCLSDINFKGYSQPWVCKVLKQLCDEQKICRFSKGWYYIPSETILGKSVLNPNKVIEKKYLGSEDDIQGFYCGLALQNKLGLSTQMPNIPEITTNNEETRGRTVSIGNQKVSIRKSRTTITNKNANVLQLLEALSYMDSEYYNGERSASLRRYTEEMEITKEDIVKYLRFFPDRTSRNLLESGVAYAAR